MSMPVFTLSNVHSRRSNKGRKRHIFSIPHPKHAFSVLRPGRWRWRVRALAMACKWQLRAEGQEG
eukprot:12425579-Alexandrium_andersonii.AAC.1